MLCRHALLPLNSFAIEPTPTHFRRTSHSQLPPFVVSHTLSSPLSSVVFLHDIAPLHSSPTFCITHLRLHYLLSCPSRTSLSPLSAVFIQNSSHYSSSWPSSFFSVFTPWPPRRLDSGLPTLLGRLYPTSPPYPFTTLPAPCTHCISLFSVSAFLAPRPLCTSHRESVCSYASLHGTLSLPRSPRTSL